MFDIGFPELLVFALVALVVLGPRRLPEAMRTVGGWYSRMRYSVSQFRQTIEQELDANNIGASIAGEQGKEGLKDIKQSVEETIDTARQSLDVPDSEKQK